MSPLSTIYQFLVYQAPFVRGWLVLIQGWSFHPWLCLHCMFLQAALSMSASYNRILKWRLSPWYLIRSSYTFLGKNTILKIWLNPRLNFIILQGSCSINRVLYSWFSLMWSETMQISWNKRKILHEKRVQSPLGLNCTPTWPPLNCFVHQYGSRAVM